MSNKKVAIVIFNTITEGSRFWGNMGLSLLAGKLKKAGVNVEVFAIMMKLGEKEENTSTIEKFIEIVKTENFSDVVFHSPWLPWLPDRIRQLTGAKVFCLDDSDKKDINENLLKLGPHNSIIAAIKGAKNLKDGLKLFENMGSEEIFDPVFEYTFLGTDEPPVQEMAFVSIQSCPYRRDVRKNPRFSGVKFGNDTSLYGCSYCAGAKSYIKLSEGKKREILSTQIKTFQQKLTTLKEIAIPFPEDYLEALLWIMKHSQEIGIKPVSFSGQFRAGAIVENEEKLIAVIETAKNTGFKFLINVVGLESFIDEDLLIFNRDSSQDARKSIGIIRKLKNKFDPQSFMPECVGSFILFHPWQTKEGIKRNIEEMIKHQVSGTFHTININDIRINPSVPLYRLAEKEGLVSTKIETKAEDVPLGGYFSQYPWKFKHPEIEKIYRIFSSFSPKTTERIGLMKAILYLIESYPEAKLDIENIRSKIEQLAIFIRENAIPVRGKQYIIKTGTECNQNCEDCIFENGAFSELEFYLKTLPYKFEEPSTILITGREPTIIKGLGKFIVEMKKRGGEVNLITNGRILIYEKFTETLLGCGVDKFLIKFHSFRPEIHDSICRVDGAFSQTVRGIINLMKIIKKSNFKTKVSALFIAGKQNKKDLNEFIKFVSSLGIKEVWIVLPMANLDFMKLDDTMEKLKSVLGLASSMNIRAGFYPALSFKWNI